MKRDAQDTRKRLLEAATAEFAEYGIAGARVDRIAEKAESNKAQIYNYFGNKDQLFDAVYDALVVSTVENVPLDAYALPDYAGALFDEHQAHPEVLRLTAWDLLERAGAGNQLPAVVTAHEQKGKAIAAAQQEGLLSKRFTPDELLGFITSITTTTVLTTAAVPVTPEASAAQREAIVEMVRRLTTD